MRLIIKNVSKWKARFDLMRFGVLTLVVVLFWVGIELYKTYSETTIPEDYSIQIEPLNPSLDLEMVDLLSTRVELPEEFEVVVDQDVQSDVLIPLESSPPSTPSSTQPPAPTATLSGQVEN
ncbi:hypothetical protein ACFL1M_00975 [Patescibacteria group bacterium]